MADGADSGAKGGGGSKLIPALLVMNLALVAAVLALFVLKGGGGRAAAAEKGGGGHEGAAEKGAASDVPGPTVKLPDFVVHLRNPEADRYARMSFEIEVATEEDKNKFGAFLPRVRDGFIAYLSDRTLEELRGSEAIAHTKATLDQKLRELAPGVKIRSLYVTDLVIQ